jgi:hypothetical protein
MEISHIVLIYYNDALAIRPERSKGYFAEGQDIDCSFTVSGLSFSFF